MSQNTTHTKQIARALVERTGMPYTRARKQVLAAMVAGLLPEPYNDAALPGLVDVLCRIEDVTTAPGAVGSPGSQTVLHNPLPEVPALPDAETEVESEPVEVKRTAPWAGLPLPWHEVNRHDVAMVLRRAGVLMDAHMPIARAFDVASRAADALALRAAMADVAVAVGKDGWTLPDALAAYPRLFDDFVVAMVALGWESGGGFDCRLQQTADTLMTEPNRGLLRLGEGNLPLERGPRPVAESA